MFMEPNSPSLLGFTFHVFSQKQQHPKMEMGFTTLLLEALGESDVFSFQLNIYNFRYRLQFFKQMKENLLKISVFFLSPLPNFCSSIFKTATSPCLWASFSFLHLLG